MNEKSQKSLKTYYRLVQVAKKYWKSFAIGIVATIALSLTDAGFTYLIEPIVNKGFIKRDHEFIHGLPIIIILIFLFRGLSNFGSGYFITRVARSVVRDFRNFLFSQLMRLPASFYDRSASGKLLSTVIYNVAQVAQASSNALVTILRDLSLIIGLLVVMFVMDWRLSSFFLVMIPLIAWGLKICNRRLRKLSTRVQDAIGSVSHIINEGVQGYKVVRLFGGQAYECNKFNRLTERTRNQELKVEVTNGLGSSIVQMLVAIPLGLALYVATLPSFGVSAGSFASIVSAMIMLSRPVRRITALNTVIQKGLAGATSIFQLLDELPEKDTGTVTVSRAKGNIRYQQVSFHYRSNQAMVLKGIDFTVNSGETVAIVGSSGSGKTTLISLLPRFYELTEGNILLDNIDIREYKLENLRNQFSLVSQHTVLFDDTVARNIAYAEEGKIDNERVIHAAKMANAYDFIQKLPQGFESVIGEKGLLLSGGQQQRIAIARALYKQAPILILDEATSSLDTHSERLIQNALANLMRQCTTLVIAHRLSTIENADRILVMADGEIVDSGKHEELLSRGGVYKELYQMQFNEK